MYRPNTLDNIVGQRDTIECLKISINASKQLNDIFFHCLLYGNSGCGKSTIARAIANDLGCDFIETNGNNLRNIEQLIPYLKQLTTGMIIFVDEIHAISTKIQELMYPVLEDFKICLGKENPVTYSLPKFTFIGATTDPGRLSLPFRDRFPLKYFLDYYNDEDMATIISNNSERLNLNLSKNDINQIVKCSRSTPRVAGNILQWIRDYTLDRGLNVKAALEMYGLDERGLDNNDRKYLSVLGYSPMGLKTIAGRCAISENTIIEQIEPYLLRLKLIEKTPRGRILAGQKWPNL